MAAYEDDDEDYYFVIAETAYEDDDNDGGFAIAASSEEDDDDYIKVITTTFVPPPLPLPLPLPSSSSSSHVCAAAIASSSPVAPYADDAEEQEQVIDPSPPPAAASAYCVDDIVDLHDAALRQQDGGMAVDIDDMTQAPPTHPVVLRYRPGKWDVLRTMDRDGEVTDEEEEENEDDYRYQGYYDLADRGRARHVKRSSGRRGRTKKASAMGRPRGDVRQAHCSVNL